jgi:hypothetical protein
LNTFAPSNMKVLFRFLVLVCLLFLGGQGYVQAGQQQYVRQQYPDAGSVHNLVPVGLTAPEGLNLVFKYHPQGPERQELKAEATDNSTDEDEDDSDEDDYKVAKKYFKNANYFTTIYCLRRADHDSGDGKEQRSYFRPFSYSQSERYISFRSIRI